MTEFTSFGLAEPIARALAEEDHVVPTPIQAQTVPLALAGRDIVGIAQTGTGKTAAFALPILHHLAGNAAPRERKACRALILSPTRELSGQILERLRAYGRHLPVTSALAIGGVTMGRQVRALLDGVDILVATPGRLLDLVNTNALRLNRVNWLVLDEADRMLDMGFIHDVRRILAKLPAQRQTMLFSATMPEAIAKLSADMLRNPARVAVTPVSSTVERVSQRIVHVDRQDKTAVLADLLRDEPIDRALVFTRTKHGADKLVRGLAKAGLGAQAIHGNKSQGQRERVLSAFRDGSLRILVATDIAARGIDVEGVSHVVNYDLPNEPESYVHRIGRTARAGASGTAISLCAADEIPYLRSIEKLIRMSLPAVERRLRLGAVAAAPAAAAAPASHRPRPAKKRRGGGPARPAAQAAPRPAHSRSADSRSTDSRSTDSRPANPGPANARPAGPRAANPRAANQAQAGQPKADRGGRLRPATYGGDHPLRKPKRGPQGHAPDTDRHDAARLSATMRDLGRVAFLHRGSEPRHNPVPHRQSSGVRKHGEGRAD